ALQAQLLLVLSADGQQAEAIAVFQAIRRRLAEELGVDPGDELREAYQLVLHQGAGEPSSAGESATPAQHGQGDGASSGAAVLPAQLPADLPWFTGREEVEHWTLGLVNGHVLTQVSTPVLAIDGLPGVGKTSLAIHLAHQLADAYPDGQLYVDLQGFDPGQSILHPAEALQGFLNALGVPDAEIPASHNARSGLYRSVLAGRRILVVLDNAHSVEQVRPLLPGAPGCLVLVTSRKRLTGLATAHGAHLTTLDMLSPEDARQFLASRIGPGRNVADSGALEEIVELCGRLPLALSVVASRALTHPDHRLADIARELREAQGGLDGFSDDDMSNDIRAVFSWSYRMLGGRAARLFRLLSLHPGPDFTLPAMASLAGVPLGEARTLVGELVSTGLLAEHTPGRFSTHGLVRAYAQELVRLHEDAEDREQAFRRLVNHYRQTAYDADTHLVPAVVLERPEAMEDVIATPLTDQAEAMAWFNADRQVLKALVQRLLDDGRVAEAWRLCLTIQRYNQGEGWWHDWAAMTRLCLRAATAAGDDLGRAHMARSLAGAQFVLGDRDSAAQLLRQSLDLFQRLGLEREQALVHRNLGQVSIEQGQHREGVVFLERALRLFEALGDRSAQLPVLYVLAEAHIHLDRPDISMELAEKALPIAEALDDTHGLGLSYEALANSLRAAGDLPAALTFWKRATELYQRIGWRMNVVESLLNEGDTALALDDREAARAAWQQARELSKDLHVPQVTKIEQRLTRLEQSSAARSYGRR
ncbi:tetratricopeptide repeat protein, partial [Actinoplanes sp. NPDC048796]|uniref:ATP-binding protein n=1 Tax=Actinoplanes sp. NPDC048796 TaxID=3155640 RepID=UPI0033C24611